MMAWLKQQRARWLMRRAIAKFDMAKYYRDLAAEEAADGLELEEQATVLQLEAAL